MAFNLQAVLQLRDQNFSRGMRNANQQMKSLRSGASDVAKQLGLVVSAGAVAAGAASSIKKAMDFEAQLSSIKALTGLTGEQMKQMKQLSLDVGKATKYSALEAAQGSNAVL